jgi:hypothetical protein
MAEGKVEGKYRVGSTRKTDFLVKIIVLGT